MNDDLVAKVRDHADFALDLPYPRGLAIHGDVHALADAYERQRLRVAELEAVAGDVADRLRTVAENPTYDELHDLADRLDATFKPPDDEGAA